MNEYVFFLGNHPRLSYEELKAVFGRTCEIEAPEAPLPVCVAKCKEPIEEALFDRLGGVDRIAIVLGAQDHPWSPEELVKLLLPLPRKMWFGLGTLEENQKLDSLAFAVKSAAQAAGTKLKFVMPKGRDSILNAAQVIFNKLDRSPNAEIITFSKNGQYFAVKTIWIQDIRAYEIRDTSRPARFGKVGMLPPKLAQLMINLATGDSPAFAKATAGRPTARILDPFCGMGTVLQEAQLMGYEALGLDISPEMVRASKKNLAHLAEHFKVSEDPIPEAVEYDARRQLPKDFGTFDAVVTEPDLGAPLRGALPRQEVGYRHTELGQKYQQVFNSFLRALKPRAKVVFLMPAFAQTRGQDFIFMPESLLDAIASLGYRKVHPFGGQERLLYARPDAWVGRELTLWERL